jgi:thiol-disulfide isomerase/thioredoxin
MQNRKSIASYFRKITTRILLLMSVLLLVFSSCTETADVKGEWRALLKSPGGDLAFPLIIQQNNVDELSAFAVNSSDTSHFTSISIDGKTIRLTYDHYDAVIEADITPSGLIGNWTRTAENGSISSLPFEAVKTTKPRYPVPSPKSNNFDGEWNVTFADEDGLFPATGIFYGEDGVLHGTFMTETGDYRFLEGVYNDSTFTLSTFDGTHAFLFDAKLDFDGGMSGNFWSRDSYHATFTAEKGENTLSNPMTMFDSSVIGRKVTFAFKNRDGILTTNEDEKFHNKPLLVYLFGSWCPNCADEARLLKDLYEDYKGSELEIVGLAYEFTGSFERDAEMVDRYRKRFDIPWTLLIAGTSDKQDAAETLDFLERVISYPTSIFTDEKHSIKFIHTGFNGPATGPYYYNEIERFKRSLDEITKN